MVVSPGPWHQKERRTLVRKLRGELDNIVLKAIQKEPQRRYESVEQFDEDLRRYLNDLPVLAQGVSFSYRARKFLIRYRTSAAFAFVVLLLLVGGIVATGIEARIARKERALADVHAREAEQAKALAESQTRIAQQERTGAELQTAEALRQKTTAQRRLAELKKLAHGAAQVYTSTRQNTRPADAALIAQNTRDLLMTLRKESSLEPDLARVLGAISTEARSPGFPDNSWHVPTGWLGSETEPHEYSVGIDNQVVHGGRSSLLLRSLVPEPKGAVYLSQTFRANHYQGKRVRLAAYLKPEKVADQAILYLNVTNQDGENSTYEREGTSGSTPWRKYEVVMDIPLTADSISMVIELRGSGVLQADDFKFEPVSSSVPLTSNLGPKNLSFTNTRN